jgi:hypothetical protein
MPATRKRSFRELDSGNDQEPKQPSMLHRIRNMWQFANLVQFIVLFGQTLKLDNNLDIEVRVAAIACQYGTIATQRKVVGSHSTCARIWKQNALSQDLWSYRISVLGFSNSCLRIGA